MMKGLEYPTHKERMRKYGLLSLEKGQEGSYQCSCHGRMVGRQNQTVASNERTTGKHNAHLLGLKGKKLHLKTKVNLLTRVTEHWNKMPRK